jgi:pimeloyl-ACP methyl ester carboxylesterase
MKKLGQGLLRFAGIFLVLLALGVITVYFNQERLVFHPTALPPDFKFEFRAPFAEKKFPLSPTLELSYLVFNPQSTLGTILYFHGNGGSLKNCGETADAIAQKTGWSVWMMDYPGFGKSSPELAKDDRVLIEMGKKFAERIESEAPGRPLVIYGRSLGGGIAATVAESFPKSSLILETTYVSLAKIGHEMYPILPEWFARFDLDTARGLKAMPDRHVLILHGDQDHTINVAHGRELAKISAHHKYVEFPGGDHDDLDRFPVYWKELSEFLTNAR